MTLQNNMSPNAQIGCIEIPEQIYEFENRFGVEVWHRQADFAEAITTQNILILCSRWFRLANYKELFNDVIEYFNMMYNYSLNTWQKPCMYKSFNDDRTKAVVFHDDWIDTNHQYKCVVFHGHMPDTSEQIKELRRTVRMNV